MGLTNFVYFKGKFKDSRRGYIGKMYIYKTAVPRQENKKFIGLLRKYGDEIVIKIDTPLANNSLFGKIEPCAEVKKPSLMYSIKEIPYEAFQPLISMGEEEKIDKKEERATMTKTKILFGDYDKTKISFDDYVKTEILFDDYANAVFNLKGAHVQLRDGFLMKVEDGVKVHSLQAKLAPLTFNSPEEVEAGTIFRYKQLDYIVTKTAPLLEAFDEKGNRLAIPYPVKGLFAKTSAIDFKAVLKQNTTFPSMKVIDSEMVQYVNDNYEQIVEEQKMRKNEALSAKLKSFLGMDK